MSPRKSQKGSAVSKSIASVPGQYLRRITQSTEEQDRLAKAKTDAEEVALAKDFSGLKLPIQRHPMREAPSVPTREFQRPNGPPSTSCAVCTRIGHTLICCRDPTTAPSCTDCAAISLLLVPDPQHDRQVKEDRIESLKLETKQYEAEHERLKEVLAQRKKILQEKRDRLYAIRPEGPKILKRLGRAKARREKEK
jgi:hypothetical protein